MKTDSLFYRLFQSAPSLFFELLGESLPADNYRFDSVEVKQTSFRIDGVFLSPLANQPVYFAEFQFQKDEQLYKRLFAEIFLYLRHHPDTLHWRAVVIFAKQSYEPKQTGAYQALLNSPVVRRFYLDRLPDNQEHLLSLSMLQLIAESPATAVGQAREILQRVEQASTSVSKEDIIELVETIMVYKFPQLSSQEIAQMLGLAASAKETRVYQEGLEEGKLREARSLILKQLTRRFSNLPPSTQVQLEALSLPRLEVLGEALLSFASVDELQQWLASNAAS